MRKILAASVLLNALFFVAAGLWLERQGGLQFISAKAAGSSVVSLYDLKRDIQAAHRGDVVLLGDSILDLMEPEYFSFPVVNRGIAGDTTAGVLERLPDVLAGKPKAIVLLVGINDLRLGVSASEVIENHRNIREAIPSDVRLIVLPLLPVNEALFRQHIIGANPKSLIPSRADVDAVNEALAEMPGFVPLPLIAEGELSPAFTLDGLHLNATGLAVLAGTVVARL